MALYIAQFPLEIFSRGTDPHRPLVISTTARGGSRILSGNLSAREKGITPGMGLDAARALATDLLVTERNLRLELEALEAVALWAGQFTPRIALHSPDALLLEVSASLRLFGGKHALAQQIRAGARELGYRPSLAMAPTPLGALLLARSGEQVLIESRGSLKSRLSGLPLDSLPPDMDSTRRQLYGLGLTRLGELLQLPADQLSRRLGPALVRYMDRILGNTGDPRPLFEPPDRFKSDLHMPAEVETAEAVLFAANRLLSELQGYLSARQGAVQKLRCSLGHRSQPASSITLTLNTPTRDSGHLLALLRERLSRLQIPAPVNRLRLVSGDIQPLPGHTLEIFPPQGKPGDTGRDRDTLVERLRARLGPKAVSGITCLPEHRPEKAWRVCDPGKPTSRWRPKVKRPLWLLARPLPLREEGGHPHLQGGLILLPERERIESGWWDGDTVNRDYYIASNSRGGQFWVFRDLSDNGHWYLHGVFD